MEDESITAAIENVHGLDRDHRRDRGQLDYELGHDRPASFAAAADVQGDRGQEDRIHKEIVLDGAAAVHKEINLDGAAKAAIDQGDRGGPTTAVDGIYGLDCDHRLDRG